MAINTQKPENITELLHGCRTIRRFTQEPVPHELLEQVVENARVVACSANAQPIRYTVVEGPEMVAKMQPLVKWAAFLDPEIGTPVEGEQPTAFIAVSKTEGANAFSDIDVGIALQAITATAWEAGVGSCIMGSIAHKSIRELLEIPETDELRVVVALGYPAHTSEVVDVAEDGSTKYYVDEARNYFVPKRATKDIARFA